MAPFVPPSIRAADPALSALTSDLSDVDGLTDARVSASFDGPPLVKSVTVKLFLDDAAPKRVTPVVTSALEVLARFDNFTPSSFSVEVWNGPAQMAPYGNSKRVDLAPLLAGFELDGATVFKGTMLVSRSSLAAKFGVMS